MLMLIVIVSSVSIIVISSISSNSSDSSINTIDTTITTITTNTTNSRIHIITTYYLYHYHQIVPSSGRPLNAKTGAAWWLDCDIHVSTANIYTYTPII